MPIIGNLTSLKGWNAKTLDRCHTCNFVARFCRATLSRDKIASVTWRVAQFLDSRATAFPIRAALYSVQLCRKTAVNADWSIPVYATNLKYATRHVTLAILSSDKIARRNLSIKLQVWHRFHVSYSAKYDCNNTVLRTQNVGSGADSVDRSVDIFNSFLCFLCHAYLKSCNLAYIVDMQQKSQIDNPVYR